jgi:hypothetical protein
MRPGWSPENIMTAGWLLVSAYLSAANIPVIELGPVFRDSTLCERAALALNFSGQEVTFPEAPGVISEVASYCVVNDGKHVQTVPDEVVLEKEVPARF